MRIRSIKPEFWRSDDIAALPLSTRLTFIGLWSYVDDNGVGADKLVSIVADLYADDFSRDPLETVQRVTEDLVRLTSGGQVVRYRADHNGSGKDLLYITKWKQHQVVNHPSKGHQYPLPPDEMIDDANSLTQPSGDTQETLTHEQGNRGMEQGNGTGEQGEAPQASPPSKRGTRLSADWMPTQQAINAMKTECPHVDLEAEHRKFIDYWTDKTGKDATKLSWDGTWRNWIRRASERAGPNSSSGSAVDDKVQGWLDMANQPTDRPHLKAINE